LRSASWAGILGWWRLFSRHHCSHFQGCWLRNPPPSTPSRAGKRAARKPSRRHSTFPWAPATGFTKTLLTTFLATPLYRLLVRPVAFIGPGDGIVAWHVYLTTLDSNHNLLTPSDSLEQEEYATPDYLWWFYPGKNRLVPIDATRAVQLQGSYLLLKATDVKVNDAGQLEGMQLNITFTNTPPSPADAPAQ
jgi:hypothetical protein